MIEDRSYSKKELADELYGTTIQPSSRLRKLQRELTGCSDLMTELHRLRYHNRDHGFSREMVARIRYFLCLD